MAEITLKPLASAEAVAFFRQKGYRITFDHRDIAAQEHQASFTVAKATQLGLLVEIRAAVDAALKDGTTFKTFQDQLMPRLAARGWWGKQEVADPATGDKKLVQLGSASRLKTIYDNNLRTAHAEGRWERIQARKGLFPFLRYVPSISSHPRDSHRPFYGLVRPVDDPFWLAHYPCREYGCKCGVVAFSQGMLDREGLSVTSATDMPPEATAMRTLINARTGEREEVPYGVHPSFNYAPGQRRLSLARYMMDQADKASAATAARVLRGGVDDAAAWLPMVQQEFHEFTGRYLSPLVEGKPERRELGARRVVGVFSPEVVGGLAAAGHQPQRGTLSVSVQRLHHLLGVARTEKRKAKGSGLDFVSSLPGLLMQVGETWLDGGRVVMLATSAEPGKVVKIVVGLDEPMRDDRANSIASMETIDPRSFTRVGLTPLDAGAREALTRAAKKKAP